jgi:prepilin-type processing-associated H-X9-DG protein
MNGTSWIVHTLPYFEQEAIFRQYRFDLAYNSVENGIVGANVIPTLYCPGGPDAKRYLDPNTNVTTNPSTHYYGVMGPAGLTNPTPNVLNGVTFNYTVGDPTANGAWSAHGILSHYRETSGSVSTFRVIKMGDIVDGTSNTLMLGEMSMTLPAGQSNQYRTWIRGNSGGSGSCKNVTYPINSTFYNGSNNFNHISFGSNHSGGCNFAMGDASVRFISQSIDLPTYKALASINGNEVATPP